MKIAIAMEAIMLLLGIVTSVFSYWLLRSSDAKRKRILYPLFLLLCGTVFIVYIVLLPFPLIIIQEFFIALTVILVALSVACTRFCERCGVPFMLTIRSKKPNYCAKCGWPARESQDTSLSRTLPDANDGSSVRK